MLNSLGMGIQGFAGMPIILSEMLEPVEQKLKWWQKVIAWNPCNAELLPPKPKPREAYIFENKLIMAPSMFYELQKSSTFIVTPNSDIHRWA